MRAGARFLKTGVSETTDSRRHFHAELVCLVILSSIVGGESSATVPFATLNVPNAAGLVSATSSLVLAAADRGTATTAVILYPVLRTAGLAI